jgi:hypothetical protein
LVPVVKRLAAALLLAATVPAVAHADEPPSPPAETRWYGWQTGLADLGVIGLWAASGALDGHGTTAGGDALGLLGLAGFALGAPIVHAAHERRWTAIGSLGLRVGAPLAGALSAYGWGRLTCGAHDEGDLPCPGGWAILGLVGGLITASIVDTAVLAREPVHPRGLSLTLTGAPVRGGGALGVLGGSF